jgi:dienelactone hydrolase
MRSPCLVLVLSVLAMPAWPADPAPAAQSPLTLEDLFSSEGAFDVAVSPSGNYLAAVVRRPDGDVLVVQDLVANQLKGITRIGHQDAGPRLEAHMSAVYWKTEDRLLFRVEVSPAKGISLRQLRNGGIMRLGTRLIAIDRDGKNLVRMLAHNYNSELDYAFDLGAIRSMMPRDPDNILMVVDGENGRSLFKVNVRTGKGLVMERASYTVWDWWLDLDGIPVVRVEVSGGSARFYRREQGERWKKFYSVRLRELKGQTEYEPLGASDQPGKFYVLARPEGAQRRGIYLYDLANESFGTPLAENPEFDIFAGFISRDGKSVKRYCYLAHVRICETSDTKLNEHMTDVRKFFKDSANVYVVDSSDDSQTLLLFVEGPSDPPAYFQYRTDRREISLIGLQQQSMANKLMPTATLIEYKSRDGLKLSGYLTRPPGAKTVTGLPLVMMPHGGPEVRDHLTFDSYVQYFASLGYAVFQPNFRGSDGFGREFAESGYGEWGRKMQHDISDALAMLVEAKFADPERVCIVGASYGGYAALAGATLTPELYKCVVAISGTGNLADFLKSRRKAYGEESDVYAYWMRQIGDPRRDAERIAAVSPALHVDHVKAPILLVHGDADEIVPYQASVEMKKLLDKSGRPTQLITLEDEGHSGWTDDNERLVMNAIGEFLKTKIGPGHRISAETRQ